MLVTKLLHLARSIAISNFTDLKTPYRFTYIVTYKCNFKCVMCNVWQKSTDNELSLEQIREFFTKSNQFSWINLSGGEIFLRKDLPDIVKIIFENCKHLYLLDFPTNGFHTEFIVDTVKKILTVYKPPKLLVTVSLDGPPILHEQIRKVPGSWDRAVETFKQLLRLRSSRFNVFFGMTLQSLNMDRFNDTLQAVNRQIKKVGHSDFHINLIQNSPHYYGNTDSPELENNQKLSLRLNSMIRPRKNFLFNVVEFLEARYRHLSKIYLDKHTIPIPCQALSASFFMDPAGNIYPCSIYGRRLGNIIDFDYDIYKLWDTPLRRELRQEILQGKCPHCWSPCEAYQSILAHLLPKRRRERL